MTHKYKHTNRLERNYPHIDINHLQSINKPTIIKTSKNWVLPPRPRPGRKPTTQSNTQSQPSTSSTTTTSQPQQAQPQQPQQPKKTKKKDVSIQNALKKIQDENQSLKLELSKLVSDLKTLQSETSQFETSNSSSSSPNSLHKKRNHLEMEDELTSYKSLSLFDESDDDNSSQISTPSLMSNSSSSIGSTLSSVPEDDVLKIEDFLNLSYFENSTNGTISIPPTSQPIKKPIMGFKKNEQHENIEFQFLKDQGVFKGDKDLFLEVGNNIEQEIIEW